MILSPRLRKFALTAHVACSVGWLGAAAAYLALAIASLTDPDAPAAHGFQLAMELTGWFVIVPLSIAALGTGLVQSLGTEWGLLRYYWILVKFALTFGAATILLLHMPAMSRASGARSEVLHSGGGLLVLLAATALSVYKPWGRIQYGRRLSLERSREIAAEIVAATISTAHTRAAA
ncbi:MAG TPA: hypothetical protein VMV10_04955 [Pirellulales bacterium]|nr:hypothetical protein [Pirellulales bacterium]